MRSALQRLVRQGLEDIHPQALISQEHRHVGSLDSCWILCVRSVPGCADQVPLKLIAPNRAQEDRPRRMVAAVLDDKTFVPVLHVMHLVSALVSFAKWGLSRATKTVAKVLRERPLALLWKPWRFEDAEEGAMGWILLTRMRRTSINATQAHIQRAAWSHRLCRKRRDAATRTMHHIEATACLKWLLPFVERPAAEGEGIEVNGVVESKSKR